MKKNRLIVVLTFICLGIAAIVISLILTKKQNNVINTNPSEAAVPLAIMTSTPQIIQTPIPEYKVIGKVRGAISGQIPKASKIYIHKKKEMSEASSKFIEADINPDGTFKLIVSFSGEYILQVKSENILLSKEIPIKLINPDKEHSVDIIIREKVNLSVAIYDEITSEPLPNVLINLSDKIGGSYQQASDENGKAVFKDIFLADECQILWDDEHLVLFDKEGKAKSEISVLLNKENISKEIKLNLIQQRQITGVVKDLIGASIDKTSIVLTLDENLKSSPFVKKTTITHPAQDGSFGFDKLVGKKYSLNVSHPNHNLSQEIKIIFSKDEISKEVNLEMSKGFRIAGEVTDELGKPVNDIPINFVYYKDGKRIAGKITNIYDGKFDIFDIPQKNLKYISITSPNNIPLYTENLELPKQGLKFIIKKGENISGTVRTKEGIPHKDKFVLTVLKGYDWSGEELNFCEIFRDEFKNEQGNFSLNIFSEGIYKIEAASPDKKFFAITDEIEIKKGQPSNKQILTLIPPVKFEGKIQNSDNQSAVSNAVVRLERWNLKFGETPVFEDLGEVQTNLWGQFVFNNITAGQYHLTVKSPRLSQKVVEIYDILDKDIQPIIIFLSSETTSNILGTVKDKNGAAIEGIIVDLFPNEPDSLRTAADITDKEGKFNLEAIEADIKYLINFRKNIGSDWKLLKTIDLPPLNPEETKKIDVVIGE